MAGSREALSIRPASSPLAFRLATGLDHFLGTGKIAMIAAYIDELIMFCAGLWMTAVGFRYLSVPTPNQGTKNAWVANLVTHFKWMGRLARLILEPGRRA